MNQHVLDNAKAYVALVGLIAADLLKQYGPDGTLGAVLTVLLIVSGAFAVWRVPNAA